MIVYASILTLAVIIFLAGLTGGTKIDWLPNLDWTLLAMGVVAYALGCCVLLLDRIEHQLIRLNKR